MDKFYTRHNEWDEITYPFQNFSNRLNDSWSLGIDICVFIAHVTSIWLLGIRLLTPNMLNGLSVFFIYLKAISDWRYKISDITQTF